jgi:DNA-binding GntR family transcriptional regulator
MRTLLPSLREEVYEHLRALMHDGRLRPGDELDLNALAAGIGTSRPPTMPRINPCS